MDDALHDALAPLLSYLEAFDDRFDRLERAFAPLVQAAGWVDVKSAAAQLGVHECTVRRAIHRGDFKSKRVGRRVLVQMPST